jgi:hypothetical protein
MSDSAQQLALSIAALLEKNKADDSALLRQTIDKINQRLDKLEDLISSPNPKSKIQNPKSTHPSVEKFNIEEIVTVGAIIGSENEKACPYEPAGKPCDHCSMCNSRGF